MPLHSIISYKDCFAFLTYLYYNKFTKGNKHSVYLLFCSSFEDISIPTIESYYKHICIFPYTY